MSEVRFAARRRDVLRRRWRPLAIGVLAIAAVAALAWAVWFSSALAVRAVAVEGQTTLSAAQIRAAANVRVGQPLARVDTISITARVASMERIQDVEVTRSWPHSIRVTVVEREPVAYVNLGGDLRALDRFGIDFRTYRTAPKGLLEAKVSVPDAQRRQQTLEAVAGVIAVIESKDSALRKQVQSVSASSKDSVVLDLTKGRFATWGSVGDSARKLTVLRSLLRIDATTYDVSAPDQPTTKK